MNEIESEIYFCVKELQNALKHYNLVYIFQTCSGHNVTAPGIF